MKLNSKMKTSKDDEEYDNKIKSKKENFRQLLYALVDQSPLLLKKQDYLRIADFGPEVVYTMGSSITLLKCSYKISEYLGIPIIPHFMDNWVECIQWQNNSLLAQYRRCLDTWVKNVYSRTHCALTIGQDMADYYEKKTGIKHRALMNSIDVEFWHSNSLPPQNEVRFVYAGGLHLERDTVLGEIAQQLNRVSEILNKECYLDVYTNDRDAKSFKKKFGTIRNVNIHSYVPKETLVQVYEHSNVLLLIESLDINTREFEFSKYSISTKMAEYLASGRLIMLIGPKESSSYKYLSANNAAIVIDDIDSLSEAMADSVDENIVETIINNAKNLADRNHNSLKTGILLREIVNYGS